MNNNAIIGVAVFLILALSFAFIQFLRSDPSFDEFASPGDTMAPFSCSSEGSMTSRSLFDQTSKLAASVGKGGIVSTVRRDLLSWRTRRNQQLKRRAGASDMAPYDALRPAYDAMCRTTEVQGDCFRSLSISSSSSQQQQADADSAKNKNANNAAGTSSSQSTSSSSAPWAQAIQKQIRLWSPSTSAFMQRPTLLCVSMVVEADRVEHALKQWKLWGHNCDDFYISVQLPTADATTVFNHTTDKRMMRMRFVNLFRKYDFPLTHLWVVRPLVSWKIQDAVRHDRWQAFRELSRVMGDEDLSSSVYQAEYTLFVRDDTYVIPENVFGFLSSPEVRHLDNLGTPAIFGHVLQVPAPPPSSSSSASSEEQHDHDGDAHAAPAGGAGGGGGASDAVDAQEASFHDQHRLFASLDGGIIWNRVVRKLFFNAIRAQDTCAYANTEADDVMLADCFRFYGVSPIDTADTRGSDRQHILRPEWAMTVGRDPKLVEWYSLFRGRPSLKGVAAISPSTMTFGGLSSMDEMDQMHTILSG